MSLLVGVVLALLSIAIVVYPFLRFGWRNQSRDSDSAEDPAISSAANLETTLESIYDAIRTLQLERQLGNIPDGLYQEQLRAYRLEAAATLRRQLESGDGDWLLEQEILVARASLQGVNGQGANGGPARCPNCNALVTAGVIRCADCGVELRQPSSESREAGEGVQ